MNVIPVIKWLERHIRLRYEVLIQRSLHDIVLLWIEYEHEWAFVAGDCSIFTQELQNFLYTILYGMPPRQSFGGILQYQLPDQMPFQVGKFARPRLIYFAKNCHVPFERSFCFVRFEV